MALSVRTVRISYIDLAFNGVSEPENTVVFCGYAVAVFLGRAGVREFDVLVHELFDRAVNSICPDNDIACVPGSICAVHDDT